VFREREPFKIHYTKYNLIPFGLLSDEIKEKEFINKKTDYKEEYKSENESFNHYLTTKNLLKKTSISIFGSKHPNYLRFLGAMFRCIKACIEKKGTQVNVELHKFLLHKNELSLSYLRDFETIGVAIKAAIKI
jgi:hypothetical protein